MRPGTILIVKIQSGNNIKHNHEALCTQNFIAGHIIPHGAILWTDMRGKQGMKTRAKA